ncbi:MAG: type II toxin-antitoxin system HicA family toxin [Aulosira sp. DedQUE10]|nr:type II toxin-antitoxin system HicA family toxin [Aulosira sp. DedQUE10]
MRSNAEKSKRVESNGVKSWLYPSTRKSKGSHTYWKHSLLPEEPLTIPGKDGDDAPLYLEKNIQRVLKKLQEMENTENEAKQEKEE